MLWLLIIIGLILALYFFDAKKRSYWSSRGVKQTNSSFLMGNSYKLFTKKISFPDYLDNLYNEGKGHRYIGWYQFHSPHLLIRDPELIKLITVKDFDHFTDHRQFVPEDIDPLWANNLFARRGKKWRDMRNILSPAFTGSKIKNIFITLRETSQRFLTNFHEERIELDFKDIFSRYANDVIAATAFGVEVDSIKNRENEFFLMGGKLMTALAGGNPLKFIIMLSMPMIAKYLKLSIFDKKASDFFHTLVKDSLKYRKENNVVRPDMLNILMDAQNEALKKGEILTDEDISAQCMVFFLAGFDTISTLMSFVAHELAINQDIQDKLREEIVNTIESSKDLVTFEDIMKLKYLDMVITETMRKFPNVTTLDRICTKDYVVAPTSPNEKPFTILKDTVLFLPAYPIHRDPEFYPNPEKFDPERFSDENKSKINPYTFLPFGIGPRNCIGIRFGQLEAKTMFFHLLAKFRITPSKRTCIPMKFTTKVFLMQPEGGFWLNLERL